MKTSVKRNVLFLISLLLFCTMLSFVGFKKTVKAESSAISASYTFAEGDFAMANGASVRISGDRNGIRFIAGFRSDFVFDNLTGFGMLIGPADLTGEVLDQEDVDAGNAVEIAYTAEEAESYLFSAKGTDGETYRIFGGSLTNIYINNYDRPFVARAYYEKDGARTYAAVNEGENVRSLTDVAQGVMSNVEAFQSYDETAKSVIESYADKYQVQNGSFLYGMNGWTASSEDPDGAALGYVVDRVNAGKADVYGYMCENYGTVSEKLFSFVNTSDPSENYNNEFVTGTLTSSPFVVKEGAWLTLSWGGGENAQVTLEICDWQTKEVLFAYDNLFENSGKQAATLRRAVNLGGLGLKGKAVCLVFRDSTASGYGGIVVSDIVTNAASCPDGYTDLSSMVRNGSFSAGLAGWTVQSENDGAELGFAVRNTNVHVGDGYGYMTADYGAMSDTVFSFVNTDVVNEGATQADREVNRESTTGTLLSSPFIVAANSFINMSWGGGINGDVTLEIREYRTNAVLATYDNTTNNTAALQGATIRRSFSTGDLQGKLVYLAFVDRSTSGYGGIIVSDIVVNASAEIKGKDHPTVVANGSFNSGLDGWTVTSDAPDGAALGFVVDRINVGKAGVYSYMCENYNTISGKLFSFANTSQNENNINNEYVTGTLKSSAFAVNADAWLTLSWGGGGNGNIYLNLYRENGERIAQFNNQADPLPNEAQTTGRAIDLSQLGIEEGEIVYIEFLDTEGGNYSGIVVSDIVTNAKFCPEGYTVLSKIA